MIETLFNKKEIIENNNLLEEVKNLKHKIDELNKEIKETRYYGSDLNKIIDKECRRDMTAMNLDCLPYRRESNILRFIESKKPGEEKNMKWGQKEMLYKVIPHILKTVNKSEILFPLKLEEYIVTGISPYKYTEIHNILTGKKVTVNHENLIRFLNFE